MSTKPNSTEFEEEVLSSLYGDEEGSDDVDEGTDEREEEVWQESS
jgi:hypothetical protein